MKQAKKLTRRDKIMLSSIGIDPTDYAILEENESMKKYVHREVCATVEVSLVDISQATLRSMRKERSK